MRILAAAERLMNEYCETIDYQGHEGYPAELPFQDYAVKAVQHILTALQASYDPRFNAKQPQVRLALAARALEWAREQLPAWNAEQASRS